MMTEEEKRQYMLQLSLSEMQDGAGNKAYSAASSDVNFLANVSKRYEQMQEDYLRRDTTRYTEVNISDLQEYQENILFWHDNIDNLKCGVSVNISLVMRTSAHNCSPTDASLSSSSSSPKARKNIRLKVNTAGTLIQTTKRMALCDPDQYIRIVPAYHLPCEQIYYVYCPLNNTALKSENESMWEACIYSCIRKADQTGMESIAFNTAKTDFFGLKEDRAFELAIKAIEQYQSETGSNLKVILPYYDCNIS